MTLKLPAGGSGGDGSAASELHAGSLEFRNSFAVNKAMRLMPGKSFTVEFWARGVSLVCAEGSWAVQQPIY